LETSRIAHTQHSASVDCHESVARKSSINAFGSRTATDAIARAWLAVGVTLINIQEKASTTGRANPRIRT